LQGGKAQKHPTGNRLLGFGVTSMSHLGGQRGATEGFVEYIRARREVRHALVISDPQPVENVTNVWLSAGQAANIGIFLILFGAFLYISRAILLPILAASIVAVTLAPLVKAAKRRGISPWLTSLVIVALGLGALGLAATMLAGPMSEWIGRAPEIGAIIKDRLAVLERPIAALHELQTTLFGTDTGAVNVNTPASSFVLPMVAFVTPAAGELLLFFGTLLFFLIGQIELRTSLVSLFGNRDTKLRFLKIMRDIERNLAGYLTVVTIINATLGTIVAIGTWLIGYPNPVIFGILAALLYYIPYVGPGIMVIVLFGVGLVSFPFIAHAAVAPIGFIVLTTMEGHLVTPTIVGRRLTLNPLLVLLALAFWTWLWGPFGAFLAVPLSIVGLVVFNHLFPTEEVKLPD
jgi:predicted PurR-regulated permease PerM